MPMRSDAPRQQHRRRSAEQQGLLDGVHRATSSACTILPTGGAVGERNSTHTDCRDVGSAAQHPGRPCEARVGQRACACAVWRASQATLQAGQRGADRHEGTSPAIPGPGEEAEAQPSQSVPWPEEEGGRSSRASPTSSITCSIHSYSRRPYSPCSYTSFARSRRALLLGSSSRPIGSRYTPVGSKLRPSCKAPPQRLQTAALWRLHSAQYRMPQTSQPTKSSACGMT